MEPVLQRFGDVTIQRVERPKPGPPNPPLPPQRDITIRKDKENPDSFSEEEPYESEEESESPVNIKRTLDKIFPDSDLSVKRFKPALNKPIDKSAKPIDKSLPEDILGGFSDDEIPSDFGTDSELESEAELNLEKPKEASDEDSNNSSFFEKLVEGAVETPFPEAASSGSASSTPNKSTEAPAPDTEDYEYDIKEKLKEMGEISFETVKKGDKPKKVDVKVENEVVVTPAKKPSAAEEDIEKKTLAAINMRRNIREVMDETKLDESTLAAQRLEAERLQRVQEQQKLLRELQRQAAQERMQNKVISLLQGNNFSRPGTSTTRIGNTVLVKLPNGQTKPMTRLPKKPFDLVRMQKGGEAPMPGYMNSKHLVSTLKKPKSHLTPSVSIAPVGKKIMPPMMRKPPSDTESDGEELTHTLARKKTKDQPPTTIDISSDDDCIVVSEPEGDPGDDEPEDDPTNSGMHTNDEFNQPDAQGRVLINVGHPESDPDIFLAPQIARIIKPHQIGGVRFLYDNVIESTSRFEKSAGFGCILAHSMGLGKTLQIVCFSDIFLRHTPARTILCIMPINTLQNWLNEYNMWVPTDENASASPLNAHGEVRPRNFNLHVLNDSHKSIIGRAKVIRAWRAGGGVLLIGYEQFRLLSLKKNPKPSRRKNQPVEVQDDSKNKVLFDEIHEALINPGPDLVICDEGHRIKNSHASISQALKLMMTKRRIVLTGYPLQNNLMEYWCMVDFARPNYLGSKTEFCNMFERPIMNGQCIDSTESDIKLMRYRAHVLHSLLVGFVQRRSHTVLQLVLPQKEEYVLLCRMTPFQRTLYETFMNEVVRIQAVPNPLKAFAVCCKIWNHPDVLYHYLVQRAKGEAKDIDLEEVASAAGAVPETGAPGAVPPKTKKTPGRKKGKAEKPAASITPYNNESAAPSPAPSDSSTRSTLPASYPLNQQNPTKSAPPDGPSNFGPINNSNMQQPNQLYYNQNNQFPSNPNFPGHFTEDANQGNFNENANFNMQQMTQPMRTESTNFIEPMSDSNTTDTKSYLDISTPQNTKPAVENFPNETQFSHPFNNLNSQNYNFNPNQNVQNFWGQNETGNNQAEYFNSPYNPNFSNSSSNSSWPKPEDKPNDMIFKTEYNEQKPKINIISDIKLPSMFNSPQNSLTPVTQSLGQFNAPGSVDKRIKIISDIKIGQVKKEEGEEIKKEMDIKDEIKLEEGIKKEEEKRLVKAQESPKHNLEALFSKLANIKDKEDGIPYDWVIDLMKDYIPGVIENSAKMAVLFCIIQESLALGDRLLIFSQSLFTLDLIEKFLQSSRIPGENIYWSKNASYYRLDGSTSALEREKLINEFNSNPKIHLFLVSTRAGSLGINLIGANRVVVLDASWNPCHDTQAVCRVYRYGQRKPCFVYRLVADNCLEKKIYDRQINKQGMSDRVVDECNPDAHLTLKDVSTLCWDNKYDEGEEKDWSHVKDNYIDVVLQKVLERHGRRLNCAPFQHESLLVDRKEKQLSQQEKRLAKKSYEREKQASRQPSYLTATPRVHRPIASVRPMQQGNDRPSRWIPAEHWQRQGMTAQEMTLPLDVVIPTNQPEKGNIVLKAGQKVLVLKSPKGVYMQLENGKIVAIKTAIKVKGKAEDSNDPSKFVKNILPPTAKVNPSMPNIPQRKAAKSFAPGMTKMNIRSVKQSVPNLTTHIQTVGKKGPIGKSRPYAIGSEIAKSLGGHRDDVMPSSSDDEPMMHDFGKKPTGKKLGDDLDAKKRMMFMKNQVTIKMTGAKERGKNASALEKLEQSTSMALNENMPFQDTLDSITNNYKEDHLEAETSSLSSSDLKHPSQPPSDASDHSDEVTYVSEQPPQYPSTAPQNHPQEPKTEPQSQEYNYNYYNYQPYAHPGQSQGYAYPPQQPPYDMMQQFPPQQPQYNYGYQAYPPPQPHYAPPPPQAGYDYGAAPPQQQIYPPPYHNPYQQQYPPPPQGMYPPPANPPAAAPPSYPDYQYQQPAPNQQAQAPPPPVSGSYYSS